MGEVCKAFLSGLGEPACLAFEAERAATEQSLAKHVQAAREAWPNFDIPPDELAHEIARRLGSSATRETLDKCHAADVYLAIACGRGDEDAIRTFEATVLRDAMKFSQRHTGATDEQAAEVTAILRTQLLVDEPSRMAGCRGFSGRSSLKRYVTIIATRELVRIVKQGRKEEPLEHDVLITSLGLSPELSLLRSRYRDAVDACFRLVLEELSDKSRALLRFKLVRKWQISQIAAVYGVSLATAHRWFTEARDELGDRVRVKVAKRLQIPLADVDSIVRLVQSCIEISFERL